MHPSTKLSDIPSRDHSAAIPSLLLLLLLMMMMHDGGGNNT